MANIRSNLPARLRQLISSSSQGAIGPVKLDSEPPPEVKAYVEKVIECPLPDIAIPLSGFCWEYGKGNFNHWRSLFLHFDTYFRTYLSCRNELLLSDDILSNTSPFPKEAVIQILRVMQIILENCQNKSSFVGLENFRLLLASTDPEIVIAALEALSALVKISPTKLHTSGKLVGCGSVNNYLLSLAQGWGSKEEGLGLYSCVALHETTPDDGVCLFPSQVQNDCDKLQYSLGSTLYFELHGSTVPSSANVIHLCDLHLREEDDLSLMKFCIEQYNVPLELRFSLLTRIRYAHALRSSRVCRLYSKICFLAFTVLVQSSDSNNELVSFFANEPEYTNELFRIVRSEETLSGTIRTLAMTALVAQLAAYSASHDRARILTGSIISFAGGNRTILLNVLQRAILSLNNSVAMSSIAFVESLLQFYMLYVISSSSTGGSIRGSGMVPVVLPLLEDSDQTRLHLVCLAVKTLQKLMDYSNTSVTLFRDLGGVELLVNRLQTEVHKVIDFVGKEDDLMGIGESSRHKRLIRALLKALGSSTYATTNATGSHNSYGVSLTPTLSIIFNNKEKFGGEIYSAAVCLMSEMIHKDPTCFGVLFDLGLPTTFLSSVVAGTLTSSKAITCIPNGIGAICLNAKGLEAVRETSALHFLFDIFTDRKYLIAMNETVVPLTNAVEELLRHVSSLRESGVDIIIEIIKKIASFGDGDAMEMDSAVKSISDKQCMQLFVFHVMLLMQRILENAESCRLFVEKKGIEVLLELLLRPSITRSPEGMSLALHSTMIFKCFTQHHSTGLARALCASLRGNLTKALSGFNIASRSFLLDPKSTPNTEIFSSLSLVEFLLFLSAPKDSRWVTALLTEFGSDSRDVLEHLGRVHREVLWQIVLLEDTRVGEDEVDASRQSEMNVGNIENHRLSSSQQFLDPLRRTRMSGLNIDSQFLDLISLYRDLTRSSSGNLHRQLDAAINQRAGTSRDPQHSAFSNGSESLAEKNDGNQISFYNSCCQTVTSLSVHISHLFQELGKVMLLPSRRRDDMLNVSPASKSVASTFASISMDHMIFLDDLNSADSESSISTKYRYLGKVTEFIDGVLLEKHDSYNPVLLNCLYGQGVIHSVLTTFQITSQLPFAINRSPSSPMETDDNGHGEPEVNSLWIYRTLASYGQLMDHLVTSALILSPTTKHLIAEPLVSKDIPYPKGPEAFVKNLQCMVLKAVLPVWTHPRFSECGPVFITMVVKIFRHIFSGVEVRNMSSSNAARLAGPPPNETTISTIVEMGFSRSRAEEALRQVGRDSVELAMEWLFSHPEEIQEEEDELARALAMSLGNSENDATEDVTNVESEPAVEEELVRLPPVDELLSVCRRLLQTEESLAFPVRDLFVMICSQSEGEERPKIISFIIEQVKLCSDVSAAHGNQNMLSALLHVLALILNEDDVARELASKTHFVKIALDLLLPWSSDTHDQEATQTPKWVASVFLAIDRLARVDTTLNAELVELLNKNDVGDQPSSAIDKDSSKYLDLDEQKRLIEIVCGCIRKQLPSETMHAALQLCATLTRTHSIAVTFLEAGGLNQLLSLPSTSLFAGFDSVAAIIIRHILEDSHTLQQAMESEIRHTVANLANRQSNGRLTPRNFLSCVGSVAQRDPLIFIQAVKSICQVELMGDRPYVVLIKDKDKSKEKEKEKLDTNSRNSKIHRKPAQSFVNVIDLLMDTVISFVPPHLDYESTTQIDPITSMELDVPLSKDKGKAIASLAEQDEVSSQESSLSMAKAVFVLKLLSEILVMYASSVHVLVRKDAEVCNQRGVGGIFHHVLHKFVPSKKDRKEKKPEVDWHLKLSSRGKQFLVAACVRSSEARKRICMEINNVFNHYVDSSNGVIAPKFHIQALVDVLNDILAARTQSGASISAEVSVTFTEVGLVQSLTRLLRFLDLDHADSPKVVTGILKVLELVTKEHVHAFEAKSGKGEHLVKPTDHNQPGENNGGSATLANENVMAADQAENVADDMEHDQETDGGSAAAEDEYMQENGDDTLALENDLDTLGIRFEIRSGVQGNVDEDEDDEDDDNDEEDNDDDDMSEDEGDEDGREHNDIEEDGAHGLPHPDDNEVGEDEFYEEVMEEDEDEDEDDEDGVIVRLGEDMDGVNMFDHIEVFERDIMSSGAFRLMPVDMSGSGQLGRSTSIYNLLERSSNSLGPSQHPLLVEPPSLRTGVSRLSENGRDPLSIRILEGSFSHLESVFGSLQNGLRNGPQGNRVNMWANELQLSGAPNPPVISQGLEDFLVSNLRRPPSDTSANDNTQAESQNVDEVNASSEIAGVATEMLAENPPSSEVLNSSRGEDTPAENVTSDAVRDVEAVSQESGGSGATLGESLRSLDVEIGSADGHDDGGVRRVNPSFVGNTLVDGRDAPLHSVTEVSEESNQEVDQGGLREEEQNNSVDTIDPAFLDALPEELRAEVLAAPQNQAQQPENLEMQDNEDIDPEFLAALPPDIREEVLAQQRAQRQPPSVQLDGQPVEMDTVSIIATFPSDIREEVLLTSSDAVLANLTPALVAEANMLRDRFARRYNQTLTGMHSRNHRGESSRRRTTGDLSGRSTDIKPVEAEGSAPVDTEGLQSLIKLLRVVQPLYKHEQKLLLNLCAYTEARTDLIKIMMDLLLLDKRKYASDVNALEPAHRLYGCQSNVTYSRPQCLDGLPPLVSRRVLETLTFLARNHPLVAKLLLELRLPQSLPPSSADRHGKAVMHVDEDMLESIQNSEGHGSFSLLLSLLNESLYFRSIAHLEQLLKLLDVIMDNVEENSNPLPDPSASAAPAPAPAQPSDPQISNSDAEMNNVNADTSGSGEADITMTASSSGATSSSDAVDADRVNAKKVMNNLPKLELQLICSLLAREGLSDHTYTLVAEVLRKLVAIAPIHCHLFITELAASVQSLTKSATLELSSLADGEKSLLSTPSTNGAPILRVLQALGSLIGTEKDKETENLPDKEHGTSISLVLDINTALEPLWEELSKCISKIESYSDMVLDPSIKPSTSATPLPAGTQNVLPYVESFFVTCEKLHATDSGVNIVSDADEPSTSATHLKTSGKVDEKFVRFSEKHRKLLNAFIRQNPGLVEKSLALMLKVPRFIDFDNKRSHFRSKIKHQNHHSHNHHSPLRISIRRAYILEDSYNQLRMRTAQELKGRLNVNFQGEEGIDAGGLTREWYQLLSRVIFDKGALLFTTVGNESTFQPNPNSVYQTEHLSYFKFVGRVVGKALFDGQLLDVHFTRSFYKHILGVKVTYQDIEAIDPDYFKNLKWLLENDTSDLMDLTFSIDADEEKLILYERAEVTDYELIEGGRNVRVTEENKNQYVDLIAEHRLTTAIRPQINAFMEGFNEMIHRDLISIFNDKELELLISGLPDIDLEDLRANTEYSGYSPASSVIQWFWEVVQDLSKEDKARLLQFVTGTSKVPLEGFSALQGISGSQKFQIHKAYGSVDHLPSAHTCFNQLDLPEYPSKERLEERLLLAIHEASEGFGFG